jgi:predicted dienelactone hydrolase
MNHTSSDNFLPVLTNGFTVGFSRFSLVDTHRKISSNKSSNRQIEVLVWYPGESTSGMRRKSYLETYLPNRLLLSNLTLGFWKVKSLANTMTHSFVDIPVSSARDRFPVLLFSHDLGHLPEHYTILMESLASEGYFVFSINHPKISEQTRIAERLSDNVHASFNYRLLIDWMNVLWSARKFKKATSYQEKWTLSRKIACRWTELASTHADMMKDKLLLLDFLEHVNSNVIYKIRPYDIFSRKMDLKNVGVFGHGWGGSSAAHSLIQDKRIKAAVNIDGFQFSNAFNDTITRPLLMIYSQQNSGVNEGSYFSSSDYEHIVVENAKHNSFSDLPYLTGGRSMVDAHLLSLIRTIDELKSFFNTRLKNTQHSAFAKTGVAY